MNYLYCGDNLEILQTLEPESVDLIYIDPPFNSKRDYNLFFDDVEIKAQRVAFEDTWTLKNVQDSLSDLNTIETEKLYKLLMTYSEVAPFAFPYLVMMSLRISELYRVLKTTGSFYLHCDPTMSHYLKTVCDVIFTVKCFRNEIIWRRSGSHNKVTRFAPIHDTILFYCKSDQYIWNSPKRPYMAGHISEHFIQDARGYRTNYYGNVLTGSGTRKGESGAPWEGFDPTLKGRHWAIPRSLLADIDDDISHLSQHEKLDYLYDHGLIKIIEGQAWPIYEHYLQPHDGQPTSDIWAYQPYTEGTVFGNERGIDYDVKWLSPHDQERLGYPTQKPRALLERIIQASSHEGDLVLDAFCGCGTTIDAAESLQRHWIGIDISPLSVNLVERRLQKTYKHELSQFGRELAKYEVRGLPKDKKSAEMLWEKNPFAFQDWWITEFEAFSSTFGTKGADKGIDGIALYDADGKGSTLRAAFQVKGGKNIGSKDIDALLGAMNKHKCELGVFLSSADPTRPMQETIALSGQVKVSEYIFPRLQSLTLEAFFQGKRPKLPSKNITFRQAKTTGKKKEQLVLSLS